MKFKTVIACAFALLPVTCHAYGHNIFFGPARNQISVLGGYAVGDTAPEVKHTLIMAQYSQPARLFRLDARQNLHAGYAIGSSESWGFGGVSMDAALVHVGRVYVGAGLGGFIRSVQTPRLSSRFTFGERVFVGYKFTDNIAAELYVQHFSNGDLTKENAGYNFAGLSVNINF